MCSETWKSTARTVCTDLIDLVWPRFCALCTTSLEPPDLDRCLCAECRTTLLGDTRESCPRCSSTVGPHTDVSKGCPRCKNLKFHFSGVTRLGEYDARLRVAILWMKQERGELLAERVGELFAVERRTKLLASNPDVIVPIPLHWLRRWKRGYDQAAAIAGGLASELRYECWPGTLVRTRPTEHQAGLSASARWENVRGAFRLSRFARVQGKRVLLVDDVLTTGATADAATQVLLSAGAAQVSVAVLAHR